MFRALLIEKTDAGQRTGVAQLDDAKLPEGDVTVAVEWSTVNYKDALAITGRSPVVRKFPMVPGIDLAGVVEASAHPGFRAGDRVLLNGYGIGESHFGGVNERRDAHPATDHKEVCRCLWEPKAVAERSVPPELITRLAKREPGGSFADDCVEDREPLPRHPVVTEGAGKHGILALGTAVEHDELAGSPPCGESGSV